MLVLFYRVSSVHKSFDFDITGIIKTNIKNFYFDSPALKLYLNHFYRRYTILVWIVKTLNKQLINENKWAIYFRIIFDTTYQIFKNDNHGKYSIILSIISSSEPRAYVSFLLNLYRMSVCLSIYLSVCLV